MILNSLYHRTARFVGVCTIVEFAIFGKFEDFFEIACQFFSLDVKGSEAFDARCVNQVATFCQFYHLAESGGVHACAVCVADFGRTLVGVRDDGVDEGRLAYTAIPTDQRNLLFQERLQLVDAHTRFGRYFDTRIADGFVQFHHLLLVATLVIVEQVGLVEHQDHGYPIGFSSGEEAVDESSGCFWLLDGDDEKCLVEVGCDDLALFGEIRRFAYDVVLAVVYGAD